jgi:hypothetical protein
MNSSSRVQVDDNYLKFRGKCRQYAEAAVKDDPSLRLVRGFYYCPVWGTKEQHWWTERADGTIHDPTALQFPSSGNGRYEEFSGTVECDNCGTCCPEEAAQITGRYAFCSPTCYGKFVGVL